jgi:SAM-dependent methyltransferase
VTSDKLQSNRYSSLWFEFFHVGIDEARTNREVEFICRCAPRPEFKRILDVCCGMGRHARALSSRGYSVIGVDRDDNAITVARELDGGPDYIHADVREYQPSLGTFDAALVMGQSFGHFDDATNGEILARLASDLRKAGRVILDLWNPEFFAAHQGECELRTARGNVREIKRIESDRLFVQLNYPNGSREKFEWQLYNPKQMEQLAKSAGLRLLTACSGFDSEKSPSGLDPRFQLVLQTG